VIACDLLPVGVGRQPVNQYAQAGSQGAEVPGGPVAEDGDDLLVRQGSPVHGLVQQAGGHVPGCGLSRLAPHADLSSDEGVEAGGHLGGASAIARSCGREVVCHPRDQFVFDGGGPPEPGDLRTNGERSTELGDGIHCGAPGQCVHDRRRMRPALRLLCCHGGRGQVTVHHGAVGSMLRTVQGVRDGAVRARGAGEGLRIEGGGDDVRMAQQRPRAGAVVLHRAGVTASVQLGAQIEQSISAFRVSVRGHLATLLTERPLAVAATCERLPDVGPRTWASRRTNQDDRSAPGWRAVADTHAGICAAQRSGPNTS
jgi:hypothetical protein